MKKGYFTYENAKNIILFLDALLAFLIIFTASTIRSTPFGKASLTFGFSMLVLTTILKIMDMW